MKVNFFRTTSVLLGIAFILFFQTASKASIFTYTWNGSSTTAWNLAANWSSSPAGGTYPGTLTTDNVIINAGSSRYPTNGTESPTITNFTMSGGTLNLASLTITGTTSITNNPLVTIGGQLNIGTSGTPTSSVVLGSSTTLGPQFYCGPIYINTSSLQMQGTEFQADDGSQTVYIRVVNNGTANTTIGGNFFDGTTVIEAAGTSLLGLSGTAGSSYLSSITFKNTGSGGLYTAYGAADTYGAQGYPITFVNNGTGGIFPCRLGANTFPRSIEVNSTVWNGSSTGVVFGSSTGTATLASGFTISVGTTNGGFTTGVLELKNFIQSGSTAQTLTLTGTSLLRYGTGSTFNGVHTSSAPQIEMNGSTFVTTTSITKNGATDNTSSGANTFSPATAANVTITNSGTGALKLAANTFNANTTVIYINSGTGGIQPAYVGATAYNGNVQVNCTNWNGSTSGILFGQNAGTATLATGKTIIVGTNGGFTTGILELKNFTQSGATAQTLTLTGTSLLRYGTGSTFNAVHTSTAPQIQLNGSTFISTTSITKNGATDNTSTGGNFFTTSANTRITITNSGSGALKLGGDTYNATSNVVFVNTGAGGIYPANTGATAFNGSITVTNNNTGIMFGQGGGTSSQASGKSFITATYSAGVLQLTGFTASGTCASSAFLINSFTGTSKVIFGPGSTFNIPVTATAPQVELNGATFGCITNITKNGPTTNYSVGGNTFSGVITIANSGTGGLYLSNTTLDTYNNSVTYNNSNTGGIYPAYNGGTTTYNGNITVTCTSCSTATAAITPCETPRTTCVNGIMFGAGSGSATLTSLYSMNPSGFTTGILGLTRFGFQNINNLNLTAAPTGTGILILGTGTHFYDEMGGSAPNVYLNGAIFSSYATITKNGPLDNYSTGGNTTGDEFSVYNSGTGSLFLGCTTGDNINAWCYFMNSNSGFIYPSYGTGTTTTYAGSIGVNNTGSGGIKFGQGGVNANTIIPSGQNIGAGTFNAGVLELKNITINGTCASFVSTLALTGTAILKIGASSSTSVFNGPVTASAPEVYLNGATFKCVTNITKTGATPNYSAGGNIFNGVTTIANSGTGGLYLSNTTADAYTANVTYNNSGTGGIYPAYSGAITTYGGNMTLTCSSCTTATTTITACETTSRLTCTNGIMFGAGSGSARLTGAISTPAFTTGILSLKNFTTTTDNEGINLTGSGILILGPGSHFDGVFSAAGSQVYLNGATWGAIDPQDISISKTGAVDNYSIGGNTFYGDQYIYNSGSGGLYLGCTNADIYPAGSGSPLALFNTGAGGIYPSYGASTTTTYTAGIRVYSTLDAASSIRFGMGGGNSVVPSGKTISLVSLFDKGTLELKNFKVLGACTDPALTLTLTGTALFRVGPSSSTTEFQRPVSFSAPQVELNGAKFNCEATIAKTGATPNASIGGNIFNALNGNTTIINSGTGNLNLSNTTGDTYNGNAIFNKTSSTGGIFVAQAGTGASATKFYKDFTYNASPNAADLIGSAGGECQFLNATAIIAQNINGNVPLTFNKLTINKPTSSLTLGTPVTVTTVSGAGALNLTNGIINNTSPNFLTINKAVTAAGSALSFVSGPVKHVGDEIFTFPVGKGTTFMPLSMTTIPVAGDVFQAEYFNSAPPNVTAITGNYYLTNCEYWNFQRVSGTGTVKVSIGWNANQCHSINTSLLNLFKYDVVAGSSWVNEPGTITGNNTSGSIASIAALSTINNNLTFAFIPNLAINTTGLGSNLFTVMGSGLPATQYTSGPGGTSSGILNVTPVLPVSPVVNTCTINVAASSGVDALNLTFDVNYQCQISNVKAQVDGIYSTLSPEFYTLNNYNTQVTFYSEPTSPVSNPLNLTTNLVGGLVLDIDYVTPANSQSFQVNGYTRSDYSDVVLVVKDLNGNVVKSISSFTNTWNSIITGSTYISPGVYNFELQFVNNSPSSVKTFKGQFIAE